MGSVGHKYMMELVNGLGEKTLTATEVKNR